jgi:inosine-uridine nucleoside N-ribohydrolase
VAHRADEYHGPTGTGSVELPRSNRGPTSTDAVGWIIDTVRGEEGLWLVATGPLTNVAHAFLGAPDIVGKVEGVSWMGGSTDAGNTTAAAEFNCWTDPEAADVVLRAGVRNLSMVGLNVTHTVLLDRPWIEALREDITVPAMKVFADLLDYYEMRVSSMTTMEGAAVHDALAVLNVSDPHLFSGVRRAVEVILAEGSARGMTLVEQRPMRDLAPANANVIEWADATAIRAIIHAALVD